MVYVSLRNITRASCRVEAGSGDTSTVCTVCTRASTGIRLRWVIHPLKRGEWVSTYHTGYDAETHPNAVILLLFQSPIPYIHTSCHSKRSRYCTYTRLLCCPIFQLFSTLAASNVDPHMSRDACTLMSLYGSCITISIGRDGKQGITFEPMSPTRGTSCAISCGAWTSCVDKTISGGWHCNARHLLIDFLFVTPLCMVCIHSGWVSF